MTEWIPLYNRRTLIDGRSHESSWNQLFFHENLSQDLDHQMSISVDTFVNRLKKLPGRNSLGGVPSINLQDEPSEEILMKLWTCLSTKVNVEYSSTMTPQQV